MIVPLLVLAFGVDIRYATGASLVSVIATSSGAAAAYVREGLLEYSCRNVPRSRDNGWRPVRSLDRPFSAAERARRRLRGRPVVLHVFVQPSGRPFEGRPTVGGLQAYRVQHVPAGFVLMDGAGVLSGLLGIGSGAVKVLAMDQAMRLPFKYRRRRVIS